MRRVIVAARQNPLRSAPFLKPAAQSDAVVIDGIDARIQTQVELSGQRGLCFWRLLLLCCFRNREDRGHSLLRARGFRVAVVGYGAYPGLPGGVIIRQSPQAGFQIPPGEAISFEVSR